MEFEVERSAPTRGEGPRRCVIRAHVPAALRYFEGHFPGRPIVPGVAQLVPLVLREIQRAWPDLGAPSALKRLKFLEAIGPGDTLEVQLLREAGPHEKVRFEIRRGDVRCSQGVLIF